MNAHSLPPGPTLQPSTLQASPARGDAGAGRARGRVGRLLRGRPGDPAWARPALLGLLLATAVLYIAGLSRNGWANEFYAAAAQAGTRSWTAFLFGSLDSANFITVDKTPAFLWVMELSARIFGLSSWSLLLPQALAGVATVGVLYTTVRRWFGPTAAITAGAVTALTPVATLMFRFDNPDALLVLVMTLAAYATTRAIESGRTRWLVLAGALLGLGYLTKMLQAFLVLPAFAAAYLWAGPPRLGQRLWQLLAGGAALLAAAGWWVAIDLLTPAASRPFVGGSTDNNILQLTFGYNGLGRITGSGGGRRAGAGGPGGGRVRRGDRHHPAVPGRHGRPGQLADPGRPDRPGGHAVGVAARQADRPHPGRGAAVGRLAAGHRAGVQLHVRHHPPVLHGRPGPRDRRASRHRRDRALARSGTPDFARVTLAAALAVTGVWAWVLLDRSPAWLPWLRVVIVIAALGAAALILAGPALRATTARGRTVLAVAPVSLALIGGLGGPLAYSIDTAVTAHGGSIPSAGPTVVSSAGGPGGAASGRSGFPGGTGRQGDGQPGAGQPGAGQPGAGDRRLPGRLIGRPGGRRTRWHDPREPGRLRR